jgi:hypothetical protein
MNIAQFAPLFRKCPVRRGTRRIVGRRSQGTREAPLSRRRMPQHRDLGAPAGDRGIARGSGRSVGRGRPLTGLCQVMSLLREIVCQPTRNRQCLAAVKVPGHSGSRSTTCEEPSWR